MVRRLVAGHRGGDAVRTFELDLASVIATAKPHECDARGHAPEPSAEPPALLVATQCLWQPDKDVVHHILSIVPSAGQTECKPEQGRPKGVVQLTQCIGVAEPHAANEVSRSGVCGFSLGRHAP